MEPLERRALLAADITVIGPGGESVLNGGTVNLNDDLGPIVQFPGALSTAWGIRNDGDADLHISTVGEVGDFIVGPQPSTSTLPPGAATTFVLSVSVSTAGHKSSFITIPNDDPDESPFEFTVGLDVTPAPAPEITVLNGATNIVDGVTTVDYGSVLQGQAAPERTFTVTNDGTSALTLGAINVPEGYSVTDGLPSSLAAGASDTFSVQLDTAVPGTKGGFITFGNNDSDENPFDIPVVGTVIPAVPEITVLDGAINIVDGLTTVNFGNVLEGQAGPVRTLTVRNDGTAPLTLGPVSVPTGYTLTDGLPASLAVGASDTLSIRLDSAVPGPKSGFVVFANNDSDENPFDIPVTGMVIAAVPEIRVSDGATNIVDGLTTVDYGSVIQGQAGPVRTFTVSNDGTGVMTLGAVNLPDGYTLTEGLNPSLAPGTADTFSVRLDSVTPGTKAGFITFSNNDSDENPFDIPVTGTVIATTPEITVLDGATNIVDGITTLNYGSVTQGQAGPVRTFTVRNDGTAALTLGAINVPTGYTLTDGLPASLAVGASDTLSVRLDSAVVGTKTGFITFANNDADENPFDIPVTGLVTAPAGTPEVEVRLGNRNLTDGKTSISFGSVQQGRTGPTRTFTVTNRGTGALTLGTPTLPAGYSLIEGLVSSLAAGASDTFTVRLDSAVAGTKTGVIRFANNDSNENPFDILVSGKVVPPNSTTLLASMATLFSQSLIGGG